MINRHNNRETFIAKWSIRFNYFNLSTRTKELFSAVVFLSVDFIRMFWAISFLHLLPSRPAFSQSLKIQRSANFCSLGFWSAKLVKGPVGFRPICMYVHEARWEEPACCLFEDNENPRSSCILMGLRLTSRVTWPSISKFRSLRIHRSSNCMQWRIIHREISRLKSWNVRSIILT